MRNTTFFYEAKLLSNPNDFSKNLFLITNIPENKRPLFLNLLKYGADINGAILAIDFADKISRISPISHNDLIGILPEICGFVNAINKK